MGRACGRGRVPLEPNDVGSRPDKITILQTVPSEQEAAMLVARLDNAGIDAWSEGGITSGFRAEAPGSTNVMVRRQDLARAVSILCQSHGEPAPLASPKAPTRQVTIPRLKASTLWILVALALIVLLLVGKIRL